MQNKKPPFEITNAMIDHVAEIAELVGRLTSTNQLLVNPTLRRTNRIRTIHGSLAIEQNTLTLEQVTAVLNGKQVLAPPKDIAEVKNAYEIYERLEELDPYSVDDLLTAHSIMTRAVWWMSLVCSVPSPLASWIRKGMSCICPGSGHGAAGLGEKQRCAYADPQLRVPL